MPAASKVGIVHLCVLEEPLKRREVLRKNMSAEARVQGLTLDEP